MEGLNQSAGSPVPFTWNGKEYVMERFSLGEWAYLAEALRKHKRQEVMREAKDLQEVLSADEYTELYREKRSEALAIKEVSSEELQEFVWGPSKQEGESDEDFESRVEAYTKTDQFNRGIAFLMSSILNRRYPGEFEYQDVLGLVLGGTITGEHFDEFIANLQDLQGAEGNQEGAAETESQTLPIPAQDSASE